MAGRAPSKRTRPARSSERVKPSERMAETIESIKQIDWSELREKAWLGLQDTIWYVRHSRWFWRGVMLVVVLAVGFFLLSYVLSDEIYSDVNVLNVDLGGQTVEEATQTLENYWQTTYRIDLIIDDTTQYSVQPSEIGVSLDARQTAENAKNVGLSAIPFGTTVKPVVSVDYAVAQTYFLQLATQINTRPDNARYRYLNGLVVGVPGQNGRRLNTTSTLDYLTNQTVTIVQDRRLESFVDVLFPDVVDPSPLLEDVRELVEADFSISGYDPVTNQSFTWPIDTATYVEWIESGVGSLDLRDDAFFPFIAQMNDTLNVDDSNQRYLAPQETMDIMREAIMNEETTVNLRVRNRPSTYTVKRGDTGFGIARATGLPFLLIQDANSGRNMDILSVGDVLNVPSPDEVMPEPPVPHKRIVVDLDRQYLVAFENGEVAFEWRISTGVPDAPTSPGVYQVLSHSEKAYGSSSTLCNSAGLACGQWEMSWFMGIYAVRPGLVNGFHGSVLLPNGNILGDGAIGQQTTFGCVMSPDDQARQLYEWADIGTTVEIISTEYDPVSDLGQIAWQRARNNT
jgi:LysM repeat protein